MINIYINPVAFGVLATIIVEILIVMIIAYISYRKYEEEVEEEDATRHTGKPD